MRQDSNLRCFFVADLQSAAFASGQLIHGVTRGNRTPRVQNHNLPDYHCPMVTSAPEGSEPYFFNLRNWNPTNRSESHMIPVGLEPNISNVKGWCRILLDQGTGLAGYTCWLIESNYQLIQRYPQKNR